MKILKGLLAVSLCLLAACSNDDPESIEVCGDYPNWETSPFVLPFPVGVTYRISQANCTNKSHRGTLRYSYDIEMPFGSYITAARDGVVFGVRVSQPEGARGLTASNWVQVAHSDGTISEYVHLAPNSAWVVKGQQVNAGDTLAQTGDTGDVGTWPHVHFDINRCGNNLACDTEPITFNNTSPHPVGLQHNVHYKAQEY